ncbi:MULTISPECIES: response regulator [unclassified Pseudoalteromonas]|uniref:phosphorylase family protein n=1 Tax=unclassified Pseudoalteromonas TaxID=194690 RepID=UPI00386B6F3F
MKILIVEDNYDKVRKIHGVFGADKPEIKSCVSAFEAKTILENEFYDIVIVDIQIPDIDGGDISPSGGIDLLSHIENSDDIIAPAYVIGLTSFDSNFEELKGNFEQFGWPLYNINSDYEVWSKILLNKYISKSKNTQQYSADVAIITALEHTELEAVLKINNPNWEEINIKGHTYYFSEFVDKQKNKIKVVATASERMGTSAASIITTKVSFHFNPRLMIMSGICAGVKGKVGLGDIVVADHVWDWSAGKITGDKDNIDFLPEPHQIPLARNLRGIFKSYGVTCPYSEDIYREWEGRRGESHPKVHLAPMACGSQVIANSGLMDKILEGNRKMLALEMESYGFLLACDSIDTPAFVAKSICDFADSEKGDEAHQYASYTSASFAFKFIFEHYKKLYN